VLAGNATTPANVVVSTTSADAIAVKNCAAQLTVQNFEVRTTTSGNGLLSQGAGAVIQFGPGMRFGACATFHMRALSQGYILNSGQNYAIVGAAGSHMQAVIGGVFEFNGPIAVTCSGTLAFTSSFVWASLASTVSAYTLTYSGGTVTGTRYVVDSNSVIATYTAAANYFPGNGAGSSGTGGQYV
jgi:hypothetical protein